MSSNPSLDETPPPNGAARAADASPVSVAPVREAAGDPAPIRFAAVTKEYGSVTALREASLAVRGGEFHCLAGPNGSGKTTLGRVAVGLTRPTAGRVTGPTDDIGYGFQRPRLYPSLTVRENLATFCRACGADPDSAWVTELTEALRLHRVAHQPAGDLSGGFQKKLDLAVALVETPTYVWLDEPLGDLDDVSVSRVVALLEAYAAAGGGVVVSTHNFEAFADVFTHLTVFLDGVQHETVELESNGETDLLARYRECVDALYAAREAPPEPDAVPGDE